MKNFVAYYRVSTEKQEHGIDAQRTLATRYAASVGGSITSEYSEHASGKIDTRRELSNAIEHCKRENCTLLIAKLDRLSRNAAFLHTLKNKLAAAGVEVVAADMPEVLNNTLMLSVMAGMAQHEREIISKRTKEGLAAAKAKGKQIGRKKGCDTSKARQRSAGVRQEKSRRNNVQAYAMASDMRESGMTYQQVADKLNLYGVTTVRGAQFTATAVRRVLLAHTN